jgi:ribosomal protein L37AE/L43A
MTLPGDPNLPPGVTTRDTDGAPREHTCPKCGSREVSDLHAPDLWCAECNYERDARDA